jgi:hypothetical protein
LAGRGTAILPSAHDNGVDAVLDPRHPIALAGQLIERDNGGGIYAKSGLIQRRHHHRA